MHNSLSMHVLESFEQTEHELPYLGKSEKAILLLDFVKELPTSD